MNTDLDVKPSEQSCDVDSMQVLKLENFKLRREKDVIPSPSRTLLTARGLRKIFGGQVVLDGVDLELHQGEVVLLRGENGSGKTTLLNILTGNLEPDTGTIEYSANDSPRSYHFPRRWWQELNPWDHFRAEFVASGGLARTWQDVRLFRAQSVRENIAVATPAQPGENPVLALFAPGRVQRTERQLCDKADAMLARLGLAGRETSFADQISLGQSKRVAIARAVAAGSRILFLDEPLAGLDHSGIANVVELLEHLVREQGITLVIIEHVFNHSLLRSLVTTDWLLEEGKLLVNGKNAPEFIPHARQSRIDHYPWLEFFSNEENAVTEELLPNGAKLIRIQRSGRAKQSREVVLDIRNLVVKRGSRIVIGINDDHQETGISFQIFDGEIVVLQAPNGWGKSTLLASIAGLIPAARGEIFLGKQLINSLPVWERIKKGLRMLSSDQNIFPDLTAKEVMRFAGQADNTLATLGIIARRRSSQLSGGQKQRLALLAEPKWSPIRVRMFDEPFANLDASAISEAVQNILSQITGSVVLAFPATHSVS